MDGDPISAIPEDEALEKKENLKKISEELIINDEDEIRLFIDALVDENGTVVEVVNDCEGEHECDHPSTLYKSFKSLYFVLGEENIEVHDFYADEIGIGDNGKIYISKKVLNDAIKNGKLKLSVQKDNNANYLNFEALDTHETEISEYSGEYKRLIDEIQNKCDGDIEKIGELLKGFAAKFQIRITPKRDWAVMSVSKSKIPEPYVEIESTNGNTYIISFKDLSRNGEICTYRYIGKDGNEDKEVENPIWKPEELPKQTIAEQAPRESEEEISWWARGKIRRVLSGLFKKGKE